MNFSDLLVYVSGLVAISTVLLALAAFLGATKYLEERGFHLLQGLFALRPTSPWPRPASDSGRHVRSGDPVPMEPRPAVPQLPDPVPDFVGRAGYASKIITSLKDHQGAAISAIGGQGGVGKTELAYYVAREVRSLYPDGQVQINLRGLDAEPVTPAEAMRDVLLALVPDQQLPDDDQQLAGLYLGLLAERRVLILADNAANSGQVAPLVPKSPSALLVTSRQPIQLPGVEAVNLEQLDPPEAESLLREILGAGRATDHEIARLAEKCGYLPLALRVAGDRLKATASLAAGAYLDRLDEGRSALRFEDKDVMAMLADSVKALATDQARLVEKWRSLAVFPAPSDRKAGEVVGELKGEELDALVGRNLVLYDDKEDRFRLHDLFRELARKGLSKENEYAAAKRHAGHFLEVESAAGARYIEDREGFFEGLRLFDRERAHIEVGQAWAASHAESDDEVAILAQDYPLRAEYILELRLHARDRIAWFETSAQAARKLGNREQEGMALGNLGNAYRELGEPRKAIECHEQHLAIARETGDRRGEGRALGNLGLVHSDLGDTRQAIEYYRKYLAIARETGDRRGEGMTMGYLGSAYHNLGDTRKAIEYYEQQLGITRETGDRRGEGFVRHNRAIALDELGRRQEAIADARAALIIREEIEDPRIEKTRRLLAHLGALPDQ